MERFEKIILALLGENDCVTIPGLGSFIYRDNSAIGNTFTLEIRPATKTVYFNNAILADDGLLVNKIQEKEGLSYAEAKKLVQTEVDALKEQLAAKRNFPFGSIGNFFLNAANEVFFLPAASLNLSKKAYGLPILKLEPVHTAVAEAIPSKKEVKTVKEITFEKVSTPEPEIEETISIEYEDAEVIGIEENLSVNKNRGFAWRIAAGFAVISMAGGMYIAASKYSGSNLANKASSVAAIELKNNTAETTKNTLEPTTEEMNTEAAAKPMEPMVAVDKETWNNTLRNKKGHYFVIGGMFIIESMALEECKKWNEIGVSATIVKPPFSSLYRVVLDRFESEHAASEFAKIVPEYVGASISVRDIKLY